MGVHEGFLSRVRAHAAARFSSLSQARDESIAELKEQIALLKTQKREDKKRADETVAQLRKDVERMKHDLFALAHQRHTASSAPQPRWEVRKGWRVCVCVCACVHFSKLTTRSRRPSKEASDAASEAERQKAQLQQHQRFASRFSSKPERQVCVCVCVRELANRANCPSRFTASLLFL
jgi:hypothetical protein